MFGRECFSWWGCGSRRIYRHIGYMRRIATTSKLIKSLARRLILPAILIAFLVYGAHLLPGYRGQMNPDGVSYLTIARQYLRGHFADAVNGYWSPLYSWLLALLMAIGVESLLATKVLAILLGAGVIASVWWLMRNLGVAVESRIIVSLTLFPILYFFGMDVTTPDLLMTAILLLYAAQMTSRRWGLRWWDGAISGLLAGLAYLAKAYALPLVGAHFVIFGVARVLSRENGKRQRQLLQVLTGLVTFGLVVSAWSAALTYKYGYFTTGTTGTFNLAFNGPRFEMPMHRGLLIPPPNDTGTSGWDDATLLDYRPWAPWATPEDRAAWERNRTRNEGDLLKFCQKFTWLLWPILIGGVWVAASRLDLRPRRPGAIFVALLLLYPFGYWLLHVYERFLSLECIGLLVLGVYGAVRLVSPLHPALRVPLRVALTVILAWSFLSTPNWRFGRDPWRMSLDRWSIANQWGKEHDHAERALALAGLMPPRSRVAAIDDWSEPLYIAYLLDLRFYGQVSGGETKVREQTSKYDVDFLLVSSRRNWSFLRDKPELTGGRVPGVLIFDLRPAIQGRISEQAAGAAYTQKN